MQNAHENCSQATAQRSRCPRVKGYWTIGKGDACYLLLKIMQVGLAGEMTFAGSRYRDFYCCQLLSHKSFSSFCITVATEIESNTSRLTENCEGDKGSSFRSGTWVSDVRTEGTTCELD